MVVDRNNRTITSRVANTNVIVTPNIIAEYYDYERPDFSTVTFPESVRGNWEKSANEILQTIGTGREAFDHGIRRYIPGRLREMYRLINKTMHYDLIPSSNEKRPTIKDGEIMYVIGSDQERVDWALFIWNQMRNFRDSGGAKVNIPFPALITGLCDEMGASLPNDPLVLGDLGRIDEASLKKSRSLSVRPHPATAGTSRPTTTTKGERQEQWMNALYNRQEIIMDEQRRSKRRHKNMSKILNFILCRTEEASREKFTDPLEPSTDEEEGEGEEEAGSEGGGDEIHGVD